MIENALAAFCSAFFLLFLLTQTMPSRQFSMHIAFRNRWATSAVGNADCISRVLSLVETMTVAFLGVPRHYHVISILILTMIETDCGFSGLLRVGALCFGPRQLTLLSTPYNPFTTSV